MSVVRPTAIAEKNMLTRLVALLRLLGASSTLAVLFTAVDLDTKAFFDFEFHIEATSASVFFFSSHTLQRLQRAFDLSHKSRVAFE